MSTNTGVSPTTENLESSLRCEKHRPARPETVKATSGPVGDANVGLAKYRNTARQHECYEYILTVLLHANTQYTIQRPASSEAREHALFEDSGWMR